MVKVFASTNATIVQLAHELLQQNEIGCTMRDANLVPGAGERPELWVLDPRQEAAARELLRAFRDDPDPRPAGPPWACPTCAEQSEPQLPQCWNCGTLQPA